MSTQPNPGDVVRYWHHGRHRAGRYVRTVKRGRNRGHLEILTAGRLVLVPPGNVYRAQYSSSERDDV
jgi:hypothetical protein